MADHQHVEVFVDGVDGVGARGVGAGRKHVGLAGDFDDVRRVAAAGAFGVVGMNGAAGNGGDGVLDEARFVERVGVDGDRDVESLGDTKAVSMAAGVVPQSSCNLRAQAPASTISTRARGSEALPLPKKPRLTGSPSAACSIRPKCQGPGVQVVEAVPAAGPVPPPSIVVTPL